MRNVLERSDVEPSTTGLLKIEIAECVRCSCGHRLVKQGTISCWYWQRHSEHTCTLELPDLTCWCGLRRSEHVDGHRASDGTP